MSRDDKDKKFEREIRELLDGMPEFLPNEPSDKGGKEKNHQPISLERYRQFRQRGQGARARRLSVSPRDLAMAGFATLAASYVIRPFSPIIASFLGLATVALFVTALAMAVISRRQTKYERRWRGRVITLPSDTPRWQRTLQQQWWTVRMKWRHRRR